MEFTGTPTALRHYPARGRTCTELAESLSDQLGCPHRRFRVPHISSRGGVRARFPYRRYSGGWEHDLKHGHGTEVWANGSSFTGQSAQNAAAMCCDLSA